VHLDRLSAAQLEHLRRLVRAEHGRQRVRMQTLIALDELDAAADVSDVLDQLAELLDALQTVEAF
jgi:Cdc6-like AAA superfamily ATPase